MSRSSPAPASPAEGQSPADPVPVDAKWVARRLMKWFPEAARDLPWRRLRTGYGALVSEAMLQQTQVERVRPAFERFMQRFPSVEALAGAPEEDVMASWQGLGYYRRARNLQAAAIQILEEFDGEVPSQGAQLRTLPGVGRYTAGAIASIVFGEREPIVDANVARVLARVGMHPGQPGERQFDQWCWEVAEELAAVAPDPGVTNEALMELGALVCTRHQPACSTCPLHSRCAARKMGDPARIPPPKQPAKRRTVHHHAVLVHRQEEVLLSRRGAKGLWAGMWEPPTCEAEECLEPAEVARRVPARVSGIRAVGRFEHRTTHRDVVFHVHVANRGKPAPDTESLWQPMDRLEEIGLANPHRRLIGYIQPGGEALVPK